MLSELVIASRLKNNNGQVPGLPKNPRLIKDDRFDKLKKSIQDDPEMLELREVIAYEFNGELVVIAGNMRLKACIDLGIKEVPTKILPTDTPIEKLKAYTIKDNVPFGENDWEAIVADWPEAVSWGLDLPAWATKNEAVEDDYEIPAEIDTDIVLGDLFEIGEHRLVCGDSTKAEDVERLMNGQKADMVFTDPPYNVEYEGNYIQSGEILKKKDKIWSGGIENDNRKDFESWLRLAYETINEFMKEGAPIYIWHPSGEDGKYFWSAWPYKLWHFQVDIIWNKLSLIISRWDYKPQHEPCMYGWKGKNRSWSGKNNESTVWDLARQQGNSGEKRNHPTMKPVALPHRAISNHSVGIIFDPFLGSGTTMVAAHQLNRKCYGIEIDPKYVQVIVDRMRKLAPELLIKKNGVPLP